MIDDWVDWNRYAAKRCASVEAFPEIERLPMPEGTTFTWLTSYPASPFPIWRLFVRLPCGVLDFYETPYKLGAYFALGLYTAVPVLLGKHRYWVRECGPCGLERLPAEEHAGYQQTFDAANRWAA